MKSVVMYYSWSGNTEDIANVIKEKTGADVIQIEPKEAYSQNYSEVLDRAKEEIHSDYCPEIKDIGIDLSEYDTVFIGTPIWWGTMAPPVLSFLEGNDLSNKTVMPFSSHGGGGKGHSDKDIKNECKNADVKSMYVAYGSGNEKQIEEWIKSNI